MTPEQIAAKLCAALIREGVFEDDSAPHHRIHDIAVKVFRDMKPETDEEKRAATLDYRYGTMGG